MVPLFLDFAEDGLTELDAAIAYLSANFGTDYAERFTTVMGRVLADACHNVAEEITDTGKPFNAPNEAASLRFSCPVYRERVEVSKNGAVRDCGTSTTVWKIGASLTKQTRSSWSRFGTP